MRVPVRRLGARGIHPARVSGGGAAQLGARGKPMPYVFSKIDAVLDAELERMMIPFQRLLSA